MRHSVLCKWLIPLSLVVISCSQTKEIQEFENRNLVISASQEPAGAEDPETRTVLVDELNVYWTASDKILVFSRGESAQFTSTNSSAAATANFNGTISIPDASGSDPYIRALYPYNANALLAGGSITTTLPSSQIGVEDTFADDLVVMASRTTVPNPGSGSTITVPMVFDHLCAGIKFSLTRDDITKVILTAVGGESIAGKFAFNWNDSGVPVVSTVINSSSTITLTPPSGQDTFTHGVWYYLITLPVAQFSQGVKFTLKNSDDQSAEKFLGQVSRFSLARGVFKSATNIDNGLTFVDGGGDEPDPDEPDVEVQVAGPDTWVATDELGRELPTGITGKRSDGQVIMFYWTWHTGQHGDYPSIVNITGVQNTLGKLWFDAGDFTSGYWGPNLGHDPCFWGEPLFGYYRSTDDWVLRKHAEMLADAGVDAVVFDCTNGTFLWYDAVLRLLPVWNQAQNDGVKVPKIAFHLPFSGTNRPEAALGDNTLSDLHYLWEHLYRDGSYSNLWYYVDGKPLIMGYPTPLTSSAEDQAIRKAFTWRPGQPDYVYAGSTVSGAPQWGWLQNYPQNMFNGEEMPVSVSQNASEYSHGHCYAFNYHDGTGSFGRSYTSTDKNQTLLVERTPGVAGNGSYIHGYNFEEQWSRALDKKPAYVFVTGWNEWNAARQDSWGRGKEGTYTWNDFPNAFPDQYDSERSRDIEPTCNWGDHGDNYYYQLIQNVRKYKGAGPYPNVTRSKTMEIDGEFSAWEEVSPDFKHYPGNTMHRDHGWQSAYGLSTANPRFVYTNSTGRNDFVDARVTRDANYVYFYVETKEAITSYSGANWMRLLINIDRDATTGWKGYDYCLNYLNPISDSQGIVSHATGTTWEWEDAGNFDYKVAGNKMEIRVPRSVLGLTATDKLDFEFKWADNNLVETAAIKRILNLYVDGDAAPGGRFNFHYREP